MRPVEGTGGAVVTDGARLYTASAEPGRRVHGERLVSEGGVEYREWPPERSKLSAYIRCGGRLFPFKRGTGVLYLGAASGTTASHVSDAVPGGRVVCVEFSPRSFRDLVRTASGRPNMIPVLADATEPSGYAMFAEGVDVVYSDVAQKRQADILADNMEMCGAMHGMVCIKARSEDVAADPEAVFRRSEARLRERGLRIVDARSLEPYEMAHEMIAVQRPRTAYCVALRGREFLMVRNERRGGWEMPGGKVEFGESSEEAAARECMEESGYAAEMVAKRDIGYCDVCACALGEKIGAGEMESALFSELPEELSFDTDEYEGVIAWARDVLGARW